VTRQEELIEEITALTVWPSSISKFLSRLSLTVLLNIRDDLSTKGSADGRR
jgi:hypothetical protein